nr:NAD(P)-binding domain-containing protein [Diaminobutyricimonas aerilata]
MTATAASRPHRKSTTLAPFTHLQVSTALSSRYWRRRKVSAEDGDMNTSTPSDLSVSVVGLGPMGSALARAFVAGGARTTVWNRTPQKAEPLAAAGARLAVDLEDAVRASDIVVTCLRDHESTRAALDAVPDEVFTGRTVVVLASGTPDDARRSAAWAAERGIAIVLGAIMVPTPVIGTPDALILYSGDRAPFDGARPVLEIAAPRAEHVGDDPGLAPLLDTAMLEVFFAGMTAFLHATALVTQRGLRATDFVPWAREMLAILPATFDGLAHDVDSGSYPGDQDNLAMERAALQHMVQSSRDAGLDSRLPELMFDLADRQVTAGHGADGWSRVIEGIRDAR